MKVKLFVFVLLLVLVLLFVYQNSAPVTLQFVKWHYPVPLALLLFSVLAAGTLLGIVLVLRRQAYNKKKKAAKEGTLQQSAPADGPTKEAEGGDSADDS